MSLRRIGRSFLQFKNFLEYKSIGVRTVGAVGAAAPPVFGQEVQAMHYAVHSQYSETKTSFYQPHAQFLFADAMTR